MKAVLIFPPFNFDLPTYMPLGIASLKSYVESNSNHKVKCFDFNQDFFFRTLSDRDTSDVCSYCRRKKISCVRFRKKIKLDTDLQIGKTLPHLFFLLKDKDIDYKLKCKIRGSISEYYRNYIDCWSEVMSINIKNNTYGKLDKIFNFFLDKVRFERPDIIGFSLFSYSQIAFSLVLAKLLKGNFSNQIVFGGHIVSIMPVEKRREFLKNYNFIDFLIEKEGELALLGLLGREPIENVSNLAYIGNSDIKVNRKFSIDDLNQLPPPDYSDFNIDRYVLPDKVILLSTSRNCPWNKCIFCNAFQSFNNAFRQKEVGIVIEDIKILMGKYKTNTFFFTDPCITVEYAKKLVKEIEKKGLKINYGLMFRLEDELKDNKFIQQLYSSGCRYILFGVETLTKKVSKAINKPIKIKSVKQILLNCKRNNIYCHITVIFGLPFQSKEDMQREFFEYRRLSEETDFTFEVNILDVQPGTIIYQNFKKYGMSCKERKSSRFNSEPFSSLIRQPLYQSDCINFSQLQRLFLKAGPEINKNRTFSAVSYDDIFLTAINSYRTRLTPSSTLLKNPQKF